MTRQADTMARELFAVVMSSGHELCPERASALHAIQQLAHYVEEQAS